MGKRLTAELCYVELDEHGIVVRLHPTNGKGARDRQGEHRIPLDLRELAGQIGDRLVRLDEDAFRYAEGLLGSAVYIEAFAEEPPPCARCVHRWWMPGERVRVVARTRWADDVTLEEGLVGYVIDVDRNPEVPSMRLRFADGRHLTVEGSMALETSFVILRSENACVSCAGRGRVGLDSEPCRACHASGLLVP